MENEIEQEFYEPSKEAPERLNEMVELLKRNRAANIRPKQIVTLSHERKSLEYFYFGGLAVVTLLAIYGGVHLGKDIRDFLTNLFSKQE